MTAPGLKVSSKVIGVFRNSEENGFLHNVSRKWETRAVLVEDCENGQMRWIRIYGRFW